jgi:hypothetical protein
MSRKLFGTIGAVIAAVVVIVLLASVIGNFVYIAKVVESNEVGVQLQAGKIKNIVGPGLYSDFGWGVEMQTISSTALPFTAEDPEIITRDQQRMGVVVTGDIFRPDVNEFGLIRENWAKYQIYYINDAQAVQKIQSFAFQAMKVCVGQETFKNNAIGEGRDTLRLCIDTELDSLANAIGIKVGNVAVPNIIISEAVQAGLDSIVESRIATEKAAQDEEKAKAQTAADQARIEGEIRVEQSRIQETTRQQAILADLERQRLEAQQAVVIAERDLELAELQKDNATIQAQKENEILAATKDIEIAELALEKAELDAQSQIAELAATVDLYEDNDGYRELLVVEANASALSETDKIFFLENGMIPNLVLPGTVTPVVPVE